MVKKESTKKVEVEKPKVVEYQAVSLKSQCKKTIGKPKCNKPWKQGSERGSMTMKVNPKSWNQKMEQKKTLKNIRDKIREARLDKTEIVNL